MMIRRNGGKCWGKRRRGVMVGVEIVDLSEEIVIALAFGASDAVFNKFDYRGSLVDNLDVAGADNEAATRREEADDGVVPLVAKDVTQFPTCARGVSVGVGNFEEGDLPRVDTGPTGIVQAFAIKVCPGGTIDRFRIGKIVKDGDGVADEAFDHVIINSMVEVEDGRVDMLFDRADLTFGQAFVTIGGREVYAERMLRPELRGAVDEGGLLVPCEDLRFGPVPLPDVEAVPDCAGDLRGALVAEAGDTPEFDEATGYDGEEDPHDGEKITCEVVTWSVGRVWIVPNVIVTTTLAAGAGGAGSVNDESVSDVGLGIGDVQEEALPEGEDNLVVV